MRAGLARPVAEAALTAIALEWRLAGERAAAQSGCAEQAKRQRKLGAEMYYRGSRDAWHSAEARFSALYDTLDELLGHPITNTNRR